MFVLKNLKLPLFVVSSLGFQLQGVPFQTSTSHPMVINYDFISMVVVGNIGFKHIIKWRNNIQKPCGGLLH